MHQGRMVRKFSGVETGVRGCKMTKTVENPQNFNVFTLFLQFSGVARVAGVAVKYASGSR